jgi:hypothetical protein
MLKHSFVEHSERRLLVIHNAIAAKVKAFKRIFVKKGLMMRTFDYINQLHENKDFKGISKMITHLQIEYMDPQYRFNRDYKYNELIGYCFFLEDYRIKKNDAEGIILGAELIGTLNVGHELGRSIEKKILQIILA